MPWLFFTVDEGDYRSINEAIAHYQATRREPDEEGGVAVADGESDTGGAILGEICRTWLEEC